MSQPLLVHKMIEELPAKLKRRLNALKNLQMDYLNVETKFFQEVYELEKKYQKLYDPLLDKRAQIVSGAYEPTDAEAEFKVVVEEDEDVAERLKAFMLDGDKAAAVPKYEDDAKGIPDFWYHVFKNSDLIWEMVQEHDDPLIRKLKDVKLVYPAEGMSYTFEFHFEKNDFFTDEVLTKQYFLKSELEEGKPFDYEGTEIYKCTGCKINWNKGKDLTVRTIKKKQKHRSRGAVRTVMKQVPNDSFFNFFSPPSVPENEDDIDVETESILESDFNIGHYIRTRIIPRAALIYAGIINDEDDDDDDEEEEDEEEDFEEEEDDDQSMDDDEDEDKHAKKPQQHHGKKRGGGGKGQAAANPECKQQ